MKLLSIIIPAYNEERRLPETLKKIHKYLTKRKFRHEILVVDDGSKDNTIKAASTVKGIKIKIVRNIKNRGKGFSINHGIKTAKGDIILFTDADLSTPIEFFDDFIRLHNTGTDVVIASRAIKGSRKKVKQPFYRDIGGRVFNLFVKIITGLMLNDTQCGFKSFKKKAAKSIFPRQTIFDFGFDAEILFIAKKHNFSIKESPVDWYDSPATKVKVFRDTLKMFFGLLKIRFNDVLGLYK
jgi:dolichyl-phosphate beta-glucosyltransferase